MFAAGHRGVDLQAAELDLVRSPISGKVHFAGYVVDRPVITISTIVGSASIGSESLFQGFQQASVILGIFSSFRKSLS
jgi:hypothetical protein